MRRITAVRAHHLGKLSDELLAAVPALRPTTNAEGLRVAVFMLSGSGTNLELLVPDDASDAAILAVIAAHDATPPPPPLVFIEAVPISGRVRTTTATPTEVYRLTLLPLTGYTGVVTLIGVDAGNGAVRVIRASFAVKRLNGGALAVNSSVVLASHADTGATTWTINASVSGNDAVITCSGAAGRVIDWSLSGEMTSFTPAGR